MLNIRYHAGRTYFVAIQPNYGPHGRRTVYSIGSLPTSAKKDAGLGTATDMHVERFELRPAFLGLDCCGNFVGYPQPGRVTMCPDCNSTFSVSAG